MCSGGLNSAGTENTVRKSVDRPLRESRSFWAAIEFSGHPIAQRTVLISLDTTQAGDASSLSQVAG